MTDLHPEAVAILGQLIEHDYGSEYGSEYGIELKLAIALFPLTPPSVLEKLSHIIDEDETDNYLEVMDALASNPRIPASVIKKIYETEYIEVIRTLLENPSCPSEFLKMVAIENPEEELSTLAKAQLYDRLTNPQNETRLNNK